MGKNCAPSVLSTFALSSACLERDDSEEAKIDIPGQIRFTCIVEGLTPTPRGENDFLVSSVSVTCGGRDPVSDSKVLYTAKVVAAPILNTTVFNYGNPFSDVIMTLVYVGDFVENDEDRKGRVGEDAFQPTGITAIVTGAGPSVPGKGEYTLLTGLRISASGARSSNALKISNAITSMKILLTLASDNIPAARGGASDLGRIDTSFYEVDASEYPEPDGGEYALALVSTVDEHPLPLSMYAGLPFVAVVKKLLILLPGSIGMEGGARFPMFTGSAVWKKQAASEEDSIGRVPLVSLYFAADPRETVKLVTRDGVVMENVRQLTGRIEAWYDNANGAVGFSGHIHGEDGNMIVSVMMESTFDGLNYKVTAKNVGSTDESGEAAYRFAHSDDKMSVQLLGGDSDSVYDASPGSHTNNLPEGCSRITGLIETKDGWLRIPAFTAPVAGTAGTTCTFDSEVSTGPNGGAAATRVFLNPSPS
jgi:hypothetical protein